MLLETYPVKTFAERCRNIIIGLTAGGAICAIAGFVVGVAIAVHYGQVVNCSIDDTTDSTCYAYPHAGVGAAIALTSACLALLCGAIAILSWIIVAAQDQPGTGSAATESSDATR